MLRLVAALEQPSAGTVTVEGARARPSLARAHRLGVAFQDHALLPWLDVTANIALPFRVAGRDGGSRRAWRTSSSWSGCPGFETARPKQLSGGMRQRVVDRAGAGAASPTCCCSTSRSARSMR